MLIALAVLAAATVAAVLAVNGSSPRSGPKIGPLPNVSSRSAPFADGTVAKFRYLAAKSSNSCGLRAQGVSALSDNQRLQGSCCTAMDRASYLAQVRGLRRYAAMPEIPRDPYDISVTLAKRLLAYNHTVVLDRDQQATYDHAMRSSKQKGPCCCRCWRWYAFAGLSKDLIAHRRWPAARITKLVDLVEGCGGPSGPGERS
jgi:hypothetical protein